MDFSIIVPVRNRPDEIRACAKSLFALDYSPTKYEVIVVDNGSTDETGRIAMQSGARVVTEPQPNRCLARNKGAKVARGRWLAFTDSDCEVERGWLQGFARAEESLSASGELQKVAALAGEVKPGPARSTVEAYIALRGWIDQQKFLKPINSSRPFAATANLAIRADVFREVGEFDPELFTAGEDADWCWRAADRGYRIQFVPQSSVVHHHRTSLSGLLSQSYHYGIGNADLIHKYAGKSGAPPRHEWSRYAWAMKGLIKSPWSLVTGRDALSRTAPWYDFLSNSAQAWGRFRGGLRHGMFLT